MSSKKRARNCAVPDFERISADLASPDEQVRARAVGALCPCRIGAENFEPRLDLVRQAQKDPSRRVRAAALHVLGEAMEAGEGTATSRQLTKNEMAQTRFRSRWRRDEAAGAPAPWDKRRR